MPATDEDRRRLSTLRTAYDELLMGRAAVSVTFRDTATTYNRADLALLRQEIMRLEVKCGERTRRAIRLGG